MLEPIEEGDLNLKSKFREVVGENPNLPKTETEILPTTENLEMKEGDAENFSQSKKSGDDNKK